MPSVPSEDRSWLAGEGESLSVCCFVLSSHMLQLKVNSLFAHTVLLKVRRETQVHSDHCPEKDEIIL